jgi:hypothetical protein
MNLIRRLPFVLCALTVSVTAVLKFIALLKGGPLLATAHPFLPGTFRDWMVVGLLVELAVLCGWYWYGREFFLRSCLMLGCVFVAYHVMESVVAAPAPCPCLGGLLSGDPQIEKTASFLLATLLLVVAWLGVAKSETGLPITQSSWRFALPGALILWAALSGAVLWWFHGLSMEPDEGMEAVKIMTAVHRPSEFAVMWNDQPPALSFLWAIGVHLIGPSFTAARGVTALLTLLIPCAVFASLRKGDSVAAIPFVPLLWLASAVGLGSMTMEAPAYAVAIAALIPLGFSLSPVAVAGSAVIAALSLNLKLTAGIPLMVPFAFLLFRDTRKALIWGIVTVLLATLAASLTPGFHWRDMVDSHSSASPAHMRFDGHSLIVLWFPLAFACYGGAKRFCRGGGLLIAPWVMGFAFAIVVHGWHRPFWTYYDLHFAVPLCVLAAVAVVDLWREGGSRRVVGISAFAAFGFVWGWIQFAALGVERSGSISVRPDNAISKSVAEFLPEGQRILTFPGHYGFLADSTTPPEIAVTPSKRFWSQKLSGADVVESIVTNKIPVIVVPTVFVKDIPEWKGITNRYSIALMSGPSAVLVAKELLPTDRANLFADRTLKNLGL